MFTFFVIMGAILVSAFVGFVVGKIFTEIELEDREGDWMAMRDDNEVRRDKIHN